MGRDLKRRVRLYYSFCMAHKELHIQNKYILKGKIEETDIAIRKTMPNTKYFYLIFPSDLS